MFSLDPIKKFFSRVFGKPEPAKAEPGPMVRDSFCQHGPTTEEFKVVIRGREVGLHGSLMCKECTKAYLERFSTTCAKCNEPILPDESVGKAWVGAPHPYTHMFWDCADTGALFCGRWGEGRLVTLHELNPDKYPPGELTPMDIAMSTGKMVMVSDIEGEGR